MRNSRVVIRDVCSVPRDQVVPYVDHAGHEHMGCAGVAVPLSLKMQLQCPHHASTDKGDSPN